jgi:hypothetical protein
MAFIGHVQQECYICRGSGRLAFVSARLDSIEDRIRQRKPVDPALFVLLHVRPAPMACVLCKQQYC